jgi:hypothetical protein
VFNREERDFFGRIFEEIIKLEELLIRLLEALAPKNPTTLYLAIEGLYMANFQLNAGDSVVITIIDTDDVTGLVVTPDAGSVTALLSSSTDTIVVDPSGSFAVLTAKTTGSTGNTVTVGAAVNGVPSADAVGTYDVVVPIVTPDATSLSLTFGADTPPAAPEVLVTNEVSGVPPVNPAALNLS